MSDHDNQETNTANEPPKVVGILAEFDGPHELVDAARAIREKGYRKVEAFSPYPIHGIDEALAAPKPILPWVVLGAGLTGCTVGILMQWYMNATEAAIPFSGFQFNISGKPLWSLPANIPVTFELIILFSAFTAFLGMIAFNKLPRFSNPLFHNERFLKATDDGFFLLVESEDPQFAEESVTLALKSIGSTHVEPLDDLHEEPIPRPFFAVGAVLVVLALLPLTYIAFSRGGHSETPRLSIWWDMDYQPKSKAQQTSSLFSDGRAMRLPVAGTVARGGLKLDSRLHLGYEPEGETTFETLLQEAGEDASESDEEIEGPPEEPEPPWISEFPQEIEISGVTMKRGRERFGIHCAVCHGLSGDGDGLVAQRALQLQNADQAPAWKPPTSFHAETIRDQPVGKIYHTATKGKGGMAGYEEHISLEDRWAIVLYVKALQRTRNAQLDDLTTEEKAALQ
ncbi:MAG: quinol:electron acceptor oxidoreductase subunit ActD [Aeoliella sp.]